MNVSHQISDTGIALIKSYESLKLDSYQDSAGLWTIGYGHILGVRQGDTCTVEQAEQWFLADVAGKVKQVDLECFDVPTTQNQFDAMCSLAFNIGSAAFCASSVTAWHRLKRYDKAADSFLLWDKAHVDGQIMEVPGLLRRREAERDLYLKAP